MEISPVPCGYFWKRWTKEYLLTLQTRQKWHHVRRNLSKDDIVLVVDETMLGECWPIARVIDKTRKRRPRKIS